MRGPTHPFLDLYLPDLPSDYDEGLLPPPPSFRRGVLYQPRVLQRQHLQTGCPSNQDFR